LYTTTSGKKGQKKEALCLTNKNKILAKTPSEGRLNPWEKRKNDSRAVKKRAKLNQTIEFLKSKSVKQFETTRNE